MSTAAKEKARNKPSNRKGTKAKPQKVAHRDPIKKGRDYVLLGHGKFSEGFLPHWRGMDGPETDMLTRAEAIKALKWHREHNAEFDIRVFRLEPVAFSEDIPALR